MYNQKIIKNQKKCENNGQVLVEFAIMLAMFAFIAILLLVLFGAFSDYGDNLLTYVGIDYP